MHSTHQLSNLVSCFFSFSLQQQFARTRQNVDTVKAAIYFGILASYMQSNNRWSMFTPHGRVRIIEVDAHLFSLLSGIFYYFESIITIESCIVRVSLSFIYAYVFFLREYIRVRYIAHDIEGSPTLSTRR
jgi:hypothetical protein